MRGLRPTPSCSDSPINSPDNRRYLQFQFKLLSSSLLDKAIIDSVVFNYTVPALADSVIAEISPATATLGAENEFTYHLRSVVSSGNRGFDTVIIHTPFAARATGVRVDGVEIDNYTSESDLGRLQVSFPDERITRSGQEVAVRFASLVTVSGTEFPRRGRRPANPTRFHSESLLAMRLRKLTTTRSSSVPASTMSFLPASCSRLR